MSLHSRSRTLPLPRRMRATALRTTVLRATAILAATLLAAALLAAPGSVVAQARSAPPPALLVKRADASEPLTLRTLKVDARIVGHLAETRLTMTFFNPHDRVLAGDLYVPLPEGATVSGYALDVNGVLVDGVVVDKHEARRAFEAEVRKGVDPGLVEWVGGNNFKTRVFPIPAGGTRTVMVRWVAEVEESEEGARYRLPLDYRDPVGSLALRVEVVKPTAAPKVAAGGPAGLRFTGWRDSYVAEATLANEPLEDDLVIALPALEEAPVRVETAEDGEVYFTVRERLTPPEPAAAVQPERVRISWDASGSRGRTDHARTIALVRRWLASLGAGPVRVDLVLLRDDAAPPRRFTIPADLDALVAALEAVAYDGGTRMSALSVPSAERPDVHLVVTDGLANVGAPEPDALGAPVYVLGDATTANHAFLRDLALRTGGAYLNLQRVSDDRALAAIGTRPFSFLGARIEGAPDAELYPSRPRPVHGVFTLAGRLPAATARVVLEYGVGDEVTHRSAFTVAAADATEGELLRRDWAQKKVADLLVLPDENAAALAAVGKAHGIVTPGTSLIVMERLEQYVEHRIRPPKSLPDMREAYDVRVAALAERAAAEEQQKLARVLALWKTRVGWWETAFDYPPGFRYEEPEMKKTGVGGGGAGRGAPAPRMARELVADDAAPEAEPEAVAAEKAEEAPGGAKKGKAKDDAGRPEPEPAIVIAKWKPETPYLAALEAAAPGDRFAVYMRQRAEHGTAPSFFLDCADFFREQGDEALAIQVLTNIAELELEEPALLRILAHRLAQLGRLDESIRQFERVLRLRPEEPQSYRDLALVLARRAAGRAAAEKAAARRDYERALALLAKVVMERWDRFDEIEVIALMELNNVWPRAQALGLREPPVDPRLVRHLPVDVRIVMTWDADMTDMDLHVVEPSREEAYYGHNRTTIGGMVTRDFTQGYGPEVYLVKKAMRGTYTIRTKFFGSSAAQLQGAVTLQVDVFTNYGRPNEKRRSLTFRLTETKEMFTVGEIEF